MRPFFEDLAQTKHEHDRRSRIEIALQHRNGDRRRVQYVDSQLALP